MRMFEELEFEVNECERFDIQETDMSENLAKPNEREIAKDKRSSDFRRSNMGYYMARLNKLSKDFLSPGEIIGVFETIKKYETAIISLFYCFDGFMHHLEDIRLKLNEKCQHKLKGKKKIDFSDEQRRLISKLSKKTFDSKRSRDKEISRVLGLLSKICLQRNRKKLVPNLLDIYEKIPFKKRHFFEFVDYLGRLVGRIETNQWSKNTLLLKSFLWKYTGKNYDEIRETFRFIDLVNELDFENKYCFQSSYLAIKKRVKEIYQSGMDKSTFNMEITKLENDTGFKYDLILKSIRYAEKYEKKIINSYNQFLERYLFYVVYIAKKYKNTDMSFADIIQEGNIGLLKAARKYNHKLGYKFITYAFPWIRQGITKAIANQSKTIRIPLHVHQEYSDIKKVKNRLKKDLWKDPDLKSVSKETGMSEKDIHTLVKMFERNLISLNQNIKGSQVTTLVSFIPNKGVKDPCDLLEKETLKDEIYLHLSDLPEREVKILEMRFGLRDGDEYTLEEVARKFQVSRERVRQLVERALNKLKENGKERLKPYLECSCH